MILTGTILRRGMMLDIKKFEEVFKLDDTNKTRKISTQDAIRIFPFTTNKDIVDDFYKVLGAIIRNIKELSSAKDKITIENLKDYVIGIKKNLNDDISNFELELILKNIYFDEEGTLKKNSSKLLLYSESNNTILKTAQYIQDVLINDKKELIEEIEKNEIVSVLDEIFYEALPPLEKTVRNEEDFINFCPSISTVFQEDLTYLINSKYFTIDNLVKLLEFYFFTYTSQTLLKINHRLNADRESVEPTYFALDWEKVSYLRKSIDVGYKLIINSLEKAFSNVALLQIVNCNDNDNKIDFVALKELYQTFSDDEKKEYKEKLLKIFDIYRDSIRPDGKSFEKSVSSEDDLDTIIECFYSYIYFQVLNSERKAPAGRYVKDFKDFAEKNFVKFRGRLGQTLNITDDYLIFLTQLALRDQEKMKLLDVFKSFERRGVYFDDVSRELIVRFYERLNILEKKSDSGVVQYVKKI